MTEKDQHSENAKENSDNTVDNPSPDEPSKKSAKEEPKPVSEPVLTWDEVLSGRTSASSTTKCWNCNSKLTNNAWCEECRAPQKATTKAKVLARKTPMLSGKCWRCKGTTSGNVCSICGSPLTEQGVRDLGLTARPPTQQTDPSTETVQVLSPKDRRIFKTTIPFSAIESLAVKHFNVVRSVTTPYGPELIIQKPLDESAYTSFENEDVFKQTSVKPLFRKIRVPNSAAPMVSVRFFYWKLDTTSRKLTFRNLRWRLLFLVLSIVSVVFTGWFYFRDVYSAMAFDRSMALDIFLFTIILFAILAIHEIVHHIVQRIKGIELSLPFFLPIPPIPGFMGFYKLGTTGGMLRVLNPISNREDLFDLYFYPPLITLVLSLGLFFAGSFMPFIQDQTAVDPDLLAHITNTNPRFLLGMLLGIIIDSTPAAPVFDPSTQVQFMHPLAYAGYLGVLLNGINLLPATLLDGSYLFRSVFGELPTKVASFIIAGVLVLNYQTWALGVIVMFVPSSLVQTPITNEVKSIHWSKYLLESLALLLGIACIPGPIFLFF